MVNRENDLIRENDFIILLLEDIEEIIENKHYLTKEEQEQLYQHKLNLILRLTRINKELSFINKNIKNLN